MPNGCTLRQEQHKIPSAQKNGKRAEGQVIMGKRPVIRS